MHIHSGRHQAWSPLKVPSQPSVSPPTPYPPSCITLLLLLPGTSGGLIATLAWFLFSPPQQLVQKWRSTVREDRLQLEPANCLLFRAHFEEAGKHFAVSLRRRLPSVFWQPSRVNSVYSINIVCIVIVIIKLLRFSAIL